MSSDNRDRSVKMGRQNYDWSKIKIDYITDPKSSLSKISDKYGIRYKTVCDKSSADGWVAAKKKYMAEVTEKALEKASAKQANRLARLITVADKLTDVLEMATQDDKQFQRHLVPESVSDGDTSYSTMVEREYAKLDSRAIKDVVQSIKMLEDIQRSLNNIQRCETMHKQYLDDERLKLERERLELDKSKYADNQTADRDIKVIIGGYEEGWEE